MVNCVTARIAETGERERRWQHGRERDMSLCKNVLFLKSCDNTLYSLRIFFLQFCYNDIFFHRVVICFCTKMVILLQWYLLE
jgi:hypothetical protein